MKVFIVLSVIIAAACAAPSYTDNHIQSDEGSFGSVARFIGNCADSGDMTTCLAVKGIAVLNRAARSQNIEVIPGVTFARDPSTSLRSGKSLSENEILTGLPTESKEKTGRLIDLATEAATSFIESHSLQFKLPSDTTQQVARAFEEGRGKMKKVMGPLALAIGAKLIAIIPIFLGGLVLLATKALVIAKIAFILAAVLGLQKFIGGGGAGLNLLGKIGGGSPVSQSWPATGNAGWQGGAATQGWQSGSATGSYPYARSYDAQELAYSAQAPTTAE